MIVLLYPSGMNMPVFDDRGTFHNHHAARPDHYRRRRYHYGSASDHDGRRRHIYGRRCDIKAGKRHIDSHMDIHTTRPGF
jgi:hypothetical protein